MPPWRAILDDLPDNARVVLRCPTGDAFAELLLACADRRLVAVPLRARVPDTELVPDGWLRAGDRGELRDGFLVLHGRSADIIERSAPRRTFSTMCDGGVLWASK